MIGFRVTHSRRQRGAALLVLLAFIVLAGAALVVHQLDGSAAEAEARSARETARALAEAKEAVTAYAATYPDNVNPDFGPGFLPCPDTDNNGSPNPPCGPDAVGRLPWRYLGLPDLRDGSGQRLWYAVSDNYRNNPKISVLNSETPGQLAVDGQNDIVGVIFAPGSPVASQTRATENGDHLLVANYLEDDNATTGDQSFVTKASGEFNDRLLAISREELMKSVRRRVLAEVSKALQAYRVEHGAYPWLSPFENPTLSDFRADTTDLRREGHLPLIIRGGAPFPTRFGVSWGFAGADITTSGTVTGSDVEGDVLSDEPPYDPTTDLGALCRWTGDVDEIDCSVRVIENSSPFPRIRTYSFAFVGQLDPMSDPTASAPRRRRVTLDDPLPVSMSPVVRVVDEDPDTGDIVGEGTLVIDGNTTGFTTVIRVQHDLDVGPPDPDAPPELPQWIVDNNWHHLIYVGISEGHSPAGSGSCGGDGEPPCLTLLNGRPPNDDEHALIISAGPALSEQTRPSGGPGDYYENENDQAATPGEVFERDLAGSGFNDAVRVVAP